MAVAKQNEYLASVVAELRKAWPDNRSINLVFHGHSVPAGYFDTPRVDTFNAYPHLVHMELKKRFPLAVINVVVTARGGENADAGARRFAGDVLSHQPDVVFLDYALNDRSIGLEVAEKAWRSMIDEALGKGVKILLLTPTSDETQRPDYHGADRDQLPRHAEQIRKLASGYEVGLVDSFAAFADYQLNGDLKDLLSWVNHPNRKGHDLVAGDILPWFWPD